MTTQYLRVASLKAGGLQILADNTDSNQFRVKFHIQHAEFGRPQVALIQVYNLNKQSEQKLLKKDMEVELEAGYQDGYGLIFKGKTIQVTIGRESPTTTVVTMLVTNSDEAHNYGVVNKSLSAGHTWKDRVDVLTAALKPHGVTPGFIADLGSDKFPKGRVMSGMIKDYLRELAMATGTTWSIQNSKLQIVKNSGSLPGGPIVLNSSTGLIGRPDQTLGGIQAVCLLNPKIRPAALVKIDQSSINRQLYNPAYLGEVTNAMIPDIASDGIYKVVYVDERGDTRGSAWYTEFVCLSASSDKIPLGYASRGIVVKSAQDREYGSGR